MISGKSYKEEVAKTNLNKKEFQSIDSTSKWARNNHDKNCKINQALKFFQIPT